MTRLARSLQLLAPLATLVVLAASPRASAQDREWDEDYTQSMPDERRQDPVDVQVDEDAGAPSQQAIGPETFESGLSSYGAWVTADRYGRVWRPHATAGWRPYYYGRWEWTTEGWLWVSDEPFGWAVYHYGRWAFDDSYGWIWVPGYQWAPAWVTWRTSGDVVGWAPLAPGFSVYVGAYPFVGAYWTFVPCGGFVGVPIARYAYAPVYTRQLFYRTAPAPARAAPRPGFARAAPVPAWGGPSPRVIEQRTGRPVTPVRVVPAPRPGSNSGSRPGEVAIFRPERGPVREMPARTAPMPAGRPAWNPAPAPARSPAAAPAPAQRGGSSSGRAHAAPAYRAPPAPVRTEAHASRPAPAPKPRAEHEHGERR